MSRNPIYLGFTAVHLGLAGATRNGWMLATCPVSAALVHRWVLREERWLHERFGRRVRRLPHPGPPLPVTRPNVAQPQVSGSMRDRELTLPHDDIVP